MADDKKYKTGSAGSPPKKNIIPEVAVDDKGGIKQPPTDEINGVRFVVADVNAPPPAKIPGRTTQTSGAFGPPKLTAGLDPTNDLIKTPSGWLNFAETKKYYPEIARAYLENPDSVEHQPIISRVEPGSKEALELEQNESIEQSTKPIIRQETRLAQTTTQTHTQTFKSRPEPKYHYDDIYNKRIEQCDKWLKEEPRAYRNTVLELRSGIMKQAEEAKRASIKPIPKEAVPVVKNMVKEFWGFYFRGYADYVKQAQAQGKYSALHTESAQIYAMRYGMSSLTNLHHGLNEATYDLFFSLFGPVGDILADLKHKKIRTEMDYQMKYSPYALELWLQRKPSEALFNLVYDNAKKIIYYIGKPAGFLSPISKISEIDEYGKHLKSYYTLAPLVYLNKTLNSISGVLERVTTESSLVNFQSQIFNLQEKKKLAFSPKEQVFFDHQIRRIRHFSEVKKKNINKSILPDSLDTFIARFARFLGLKSIAKNMRRTDRDILSYFTILIGGWIFDVTFGNIGRIIVEKLATTQIWQKLAGIRAEFLNNPLMKSFGFGAETTKAFLGAGPSLNTFAGGYLGYNVGGLIGQNLAGMLNISPSVGFTVGSAVGAGVGGGLGWGYQWALNLTKSPSLMNFSLNNNLLRGGQYNLNGFYRYMTDKYGADSFSSQNLGKTIAEIEKSHLLGGPGPVMRFANFLNSPFGKFFRIPIKGLAVSNLLSPFEAQIQQVFPLYQSWMPPFTQWFWEVKGAIWDTAFKPVFGRVGDFAKFSKMGEWGFSPSDGNLTYTMEAVSAEGPITGNLWKTNIPSKYIQYLESTNEFKVVEARGWYKSYLEFRIDLHEYMNTLLGRTSLPLSNRLLGFFTEHPRIGKFMQNTAQNIKAVGLTNFAGLIIGWEIASLMFPGSLLMAVAGGAVGWLALNPLLRIVYTVVNKIFGSVLGYQMLPSFFSRFAGLFNTGFWLGTGMQAIAGMLGIENVFLSSMWFPIATGFAFTVAPAILTWVGGAISLHAVAGSVGAAVGGLISGLGSAMAFGGTLAAISTMLGIGFVAVFTMFTVILVGSAFWIPLEETLRGITDVSQCFEISQPIFDNGGPAIFKKGKEHKICWTTTVLNDLYPGGITSEKTYSPADNFTFNSYEINIRDPFGTSLATFTGTGAVTNPPDSRGYKLNMSNINIPTGPGGVLNNIGKSFTITPPKDTGGIFDSQVIEHIKNIAVNTERVEVLVSQEIISQWNNEFMADYLLNRQVDLLNKIGNETDQSKIDNILKEQNAILVSDINSNYSINKLIVGATSFGDRGYTVNYIASCQNWDRQKQTNSDLQPPYQGCSQLIGEFNDKTPKINKAKSQLFEASRLPPLQRAETIRELNRQMSQIKNKDNTRSSTALIIKVKDAFPDPNVPTDPAKLAEYNKRIEALAKEQTRGQTMRYIPKNSTITVCINVTYEGEDNKYASVSEKDAAVIPLAGDIFTTVNCQAAVNTPINAGAQGQIGWPTTNRNVSQSYNPYITPSTDARDYAKNGHKGDDFPGQMKDPVFATTGGKIVETGYDKPTSLGGFGNYMIIEGIDGKYYLYGHLGDNVGKEQTAFTKKTGDTILPGEQIGYLGNSGTATGPHLHLGISTGSRLSDFYNNSTTTINPCLLLTGGCR